MHGHELQVNFQQLATASASFRTGQLDLDLASTSGPVGWRSGRVGEMAGGGWGVFFSGNGC